MTNDDFEDLVDRWGENVSAWPEPQRTAARDLLARSAEARTLLAEAVALRRALAPRDAARAPADLSARILAAALDPPAADTPAADTPAAAPAAGAPAASAPVAAPAGRRPIDPRAVPAPRRRRPPGVAWLGRPLRPAVVLSLCFLLGLATSFLVDAPPAASPVALPGSVLGELR